MNATRISILLAPLFLVACSGASSTGVTPINKLALPQADTIEGVVTQVKKDEIMLRDASGVLEVDFENVKGGKVPAYVRPGTVLRVTGYKDVDGDFDAIEVVKVGETPANVKPAKKMKPVKQSEK